jgi:hypothetical protein
MEKHNLTDFNDRLFELFDRMQDKGLTGEKLTVQFTQFNQKKNA